MFYLNSPIIIFIAKYYKQFTFKYRSDIIFLSPFCLQYFQTQLFKFNHFFVFIYLIKPMMLILSEDNDKVYVQTQNQFASKQQTILKLKLLQEDLKDYRQLHPKIKQFNILLTNTVKQFYEFLTDWKQQNQKSQKDVKKKNLPIPYGIIKKFQKLRTIFIQCNQIIHQQSLFYHQIIKNQKNYKIADQKFYKWILRNYEQKRKYFKNYTLDLQQKVQRIEDVVKKLQYHSNHYYTEFNNAILPVFYLIHYDKKIQAFNRFTIQLLSYAQQKRKINKIIQEVLKNCQKIEKNQQKDQTLNKEEKQVENQPKIQKKIQKPRRTSKTRIQIFKQILIKKMSQIQIKQNYLAKLRQRNAKIKQKNSKLKESTLQQQNKKYFENIQKCISVDIKILRLSKDPHQQIKSDKKLKITKTDYLIYMKQLFSKIKQIFDKDIHYNFKSKKQERSKSL